MLCFSYPTMSYILFFPNLKFCNDIKGLSGRFPVRDTVSLSARDEASTKKKYSSKY